jgi:hypothetical protein
MSYKRTGYVFYMKKGQIPVILLKLNLPMASLYVNDVYEISNAINVQLQAWDLQGTERTFCYTTTEREDEKTIESSQFKELLQMLKDHFTYAPSGAGAIEAEKDFDEKKDTKKS